MWTCDVRETIKIQTRSGIVPEEGLSGKFLVQFATEKVSPRGWGCGSILTDEGNTKRGKRD